MVLTFLIALGVLEAGLFLIGPVLQSNVFYVVLRVSTILVFSYLCSRVYKKSLYGVLSLTGLLIFLDQVIFKSIWLLMEFRRDPGAWQGVDQMGALYGSAFSYIVFLPVILILAFVGVFAANYPRHYKTPKT